MRKQAERKPALECRCRACGWRGLTAGRSATIWFVRGYLVLSVLALLAHTLNLVELPRLITPPISIAILVALPLFPTIAGRFFDACPSCRSRSIETVPKDDVAGQLGA